MLGRTCTICKEFESDYSKLGRRMTHGKLAILSRHLLCIEELRARGKENTNVKNKLRLENLKIKTKERKSEKLAEQILFGKICPKCDIKKPLSAFYKTKRATSYCKTCHSSVTRKIAIENQVETAAYQKAYQSTWLEANREHRKTYMKKRYKKKKEESLKTQTA